jgi:hypothetical protein
MIKIHSNLNKKRIQPKNKTKKNISTSYSLPSHSPIYNESDYQNNNGMLTRIWGPAMWHYLHTMSFNYPVNPDVKTKHHYRDFILSLQYVLPCGKCRKNLTKNFKRLPLKMENMKSRLEFSTYIFNLHELINTMLKKKSGLTYEIVRERYEHFRARCNTKTKKKTIKLRSNTEKNHEKGCVDPLYGEKSKCILRIVPQQEKCETFNIDKKCSSQDLSNVYEQPNYTVRKEK